MPRWKQATAAAQQAKSGIFFRLAANEFQDVVLLDEPKIEHKIWEGTKPRPWTPSDPVSQKQTNFVFNVYNLTLGKVQLLSVNPFVFDEIDELVEELGDKVVIRIIKKENEKKKMSYRARLSPLNSNPALFDDVDFDSLDLLPKEAPKAEAVADGAV